MSFRFFSEQPFSLLNGTTLSEQTDNDYFQKLIPFYVSEEISSALKTIHKRYGEYPYEDGTNVPFIVQARSELSRLTGINKNILNSIVIVAPHTHWNDNNPIIYTFDQNNDRYLIGPQTPKASKTYRPVSFVFTGINTIPYEWIDDSIQISEDELKLTYEIIEQFSFHFVKSPIPFGLSIDFRFKNSLFDLPNETTEHPIDLEKSNLSRIHLTHTHKNLQPNDKTEQVAWHAFSPDHFGLLESDIPLFEKITQFINENPESKDEVYNFIRNQRSSFNS